MEDTARGMAATMALPARRPRVPDVGTLLLAASRRWLLCLVLAVPAAALAAAAAWLLTPGQYIAASFLRVRTNEDFILQPSEAAVPASSFLRFQERVITFPHVLQRALDDPRLRSLDFAPAGVDRQLWLRDNITVTYPRNTELMNIEIAHHDPHIAREVANGVTRAYLAEVQASAESERDLKRQELERLTVEADKQLKGQWETLQEMARTLGTGNPQALSLREQIQLESYREYAQRLRQTRFERNNLERELQTLSNQLGVESAPESGEPTFQQQLEQDSQLLEMRRQISALIADIAAFEGTSRDQNLPELQRLRSQRQQLEQQMTDRSRELQAAWSAQRQRIVQSQQQRTLEQTEARLASFRQEEKFLSELLNQLEGQIDVAGGQQSVELEMLRHDIERQERIADSLWNSLENLRIEEQAHPRVQLIQWARLPEQRSQRKQLRNALLAGPGTWLIVVLTIGLLEFRSRRIRTPHDARRATGLTLFAAQLAGDQQNDETPVAQAAATALRLARSGQLKCILISSCRADQGQEQLAAMLATRLAGTGRSTLVVDLYLTGSTLPERLGLQPHAAGLSELLEGAPEEVCLHRTAWPGLAVLPAGQAPGDSYVLLATEALDQSLTRWKEQYDVLILQAAPLLQSSDALLIAHHIDWVLLAAQVDTSRSDDLEHVEQQLAVADLHAGAIVLLRSQQERLVRAPHFRMSARRHRPTTSPAPQTNRAEQPAESSAPRTGSEPRRATNTGTAIKDPS